MITPTMKDTSGRIDVIVIVSKDKPVQELTRPRAELRFQQWANW